MSPTILLAAALCVGTIHDGDTFRTCAGERIRIANIDAPEMPGSPKCTDRRRAGGRKGWCDFPLATQSRDTLARFIRSGPVRIRRSATDRYGRTLATVSVNGVDAGEYLISRHLARRW